MKRFFKLMCVVVIFSITSCMTSSTDFEKGKRQLISQGYTDVINTGYSSFCCGESDTFSTGFSCVDKSGNKVTGCFCSSVLKGITIRFE